MNSLRAFLKKDWEWSKKIVKWAVVAFFAYVAFFMVSVVLVMSAIAIGIWS